MRCLLLVLLGLRGLGAFALSARPHSQSLQSSRTTTMSLPDHQMHSSQPQDSRSRLRRQIGSTLTLAGLLGSTLGVMQMALADSSATEENVALVLDAATAAAPIVPPKPLPDYDFGSFKLPYNHENVPLGELLGKATVVCNIKLDDPQTVMQYPALREIYEKYVDQGLSVLVFPTEQGYFEPDDDETVRAKSKEYFSFGSYPRAVVFDKVDVLGPSAHPLYAALTSARPTPNGYSRITLNYEKFLLDAAGKPVRRYPRKFSAYDMEADISALLKGEALPEESPAFQKAWREAKREAVKSEYAFRYNYNYYTAPDSMYKYNPSKDRIG